MEEDKPQEPIEPQKETPQAPAENQNENPGFQTAQSSLPQPPPTQEEMPPQESIPPPTSLRKKALMVYLGLFLFLLLLGGGSLALSYTNYKIFAPPKVWANLVDSFILRTPLPKTPRLILGQTQKKMVSLKTAIVETELAFAANDKDFPVKSAKIIVRGPADFKEKKPNRSQFDIAGEIALEGIQISAAGSVRQIEDNLYFKLTEFPGGSFLPLNDLKDQWFVINTNEFQKKKGEKPDEKTNQKIKEVAEKFVAKAPSWTTLEKNSRRDTYSLLVRPPREEINNFIFELVEAIEPKRQTELSRSIQKDKLAEFTKNIEKIEIKLKVRKKDYLIDEGRLIFSFNFQSPLLSQSGKINLSPTRSIPMSLSATARLSNFGEPVIVEIPPDARDLNEYLGGLGKLLRKNQEKPPTGFLPKPKESTPSAKLPQEKPQTPQGGLRDLLEETSPVLGTGEKYWDLLLIKSILDLLPQ